MQIVDKRNSARKGGVFLCLHHPKAVVISKQRFVVASGLIFSEKKNELWVKLFNLAFQLARFFSVIKE